MAFRLKSILGKEWSENSNEFRNVVNAYQRKSWNGGLESIGKEEGGKGQSATRGTYKLRYFEFFAIRAGIYDCHAFHCVYCLKCL